jgi:hypothetical protein
MLRIMGAYCLFYAVFPEKNGSTMNIPPTLTIAIWTLRSVPIVMALITMVSTAQDGSSPMLWVNALGLIGIVSAIFYLDRLKRLSWPVGQVIYVYVFVALILQDSQGLLGHLLNGRIPQISWQDTVRLLWVIATIVVSGLIIEALVAELALLKKWAWRLAMGLSLLYILSLVFFLPGTLSLWCLYNWETKDAFKKKRVAHLEDG